MRKLFIILALTFVSSIVYSQQKGNYDNDIKTIQAYDRIYKIPEHPIVFTGSSSVRMWTNLQEVFGQYNVINRGIGGAVIDDIAYYANELVIRYKPRQVVLYVGDNDLGHDSETADTISNKTISLYRKIRAALPDVPFVYISIKPSPSREKFRSKIEAANTLLKQFFSHELHTSFVDVYPLMLSKDGSFRRELFQPDMTHMLPPGYKIWENALKPVLVASQNH